MDASFYSNSVHVDFESVLAMGEPGMVSMFQALIASGLQEFMGCPAVVYEDALVKFFANGTVRDGLVVSSVNGVVVEISEELFAETFDLLVVGLADVSEIPKDKIFDAQSIVSLTGEPVILSGSKSQMKMHYRLLCDIMAKSISVKAGSFNEITVEKFSLLTAVVCDVRMNWGSVLFGIFKKMVTPGSKQAKGFAIQISILLESVPNLELGESSEFPSSKILTIQRYIAIIDKSGEQAPADALKVKKAPTTKGASKKRPADFPLEVPVLKKKRTIKKKPVTSLSTLEMVAVAQAAVPIQMFETSIVAPSVEVPAEETRCSSADDMDVIIQQVIEETREVDASADRHEPAATEERHWFDLPYEDLIEKWAAERPVVTASDTDEEDVPMDVGTADEDQQKSLEDILLEIPVDVPLPSTGMEITKIVMGQEMKIPGVTEKTWFLSSLPQIPVDHNGKEILVEKDPIQGNPAQEHNFLICADIDLLVDLRAKRKNNRKGPGGDQYEKLQKQTTTFIGCLSGLPCWHLCLAPTGISRIRLFSVDCGRLSPIRSTIRSETPSSGCTRSADEISTNGFSSSNCPEIIFGDDRRRRRRRRERGKDGAASFRVIRVWCV
ncbi:hypothetical protein F511_36729 [Dorcoceras hygrometricum]|uniref:Dystroglycan-like n=1 Tax=Dorcoceras hygrometricum TaxID=472368 RepID=A0A2Z7BUF9_9LAMI|nr:hypothetical protein F511_36729 [Dorcoceras hygrometricum]